MKRTMSKMILSAMLLSGTVNVMAAEEKIVCPSIQLIKQSWMLLDTVTKATSPRFVISSNMSHMQDLSHRPWTIVTYADTDNMNSALEMGQSIVQNITEAKMKYAADMSEIYLCSYKSPNAVLGVGLISEKNGNNSMFQLTSINLNLLK